MKKLIKNSFFTDNSTVSFSAALLIHAALLAALFMKFITLEQERQKKQAQKQKMAAPHVPPPVLLYASPSVNPTPSKNRSSRSHPSHKAMEGTAAQNDKIKKIAAPRVPSFSKEQLQEAAQLAKEEIKKESQQKLSKKDTVAKPIKKEIVKPKPIQETKKQATNLISIPKEPSKDRSSRSLHSLRMTPDDSTTKQKTDSDEIRKRKLTLADLFKTMPHIMEEVQKHAKEGGSDQLVIAQGDMRYYSFLKKFITHMNQVFAFKGGPQTLQKWAEEGRIKKNVGISIVIDRKGNVLETIFLSSSGYKLFDDLTKETVQEASPFPPVPEQFKEKTVRVELTSAL